VERILKVALIADTHSGVRNDNVHFTNNFKTGLDNLFFPYLKKHGISRVIHLGDIVDRRKYCNIYTAYRLRKDFLDPMAEMGIQWDLIAGNHDEYYKNTNEVNFISEFIDGKYPNCKVHINCSEINIDGLPILMIPWICDSNIKDTYEKIQHTKAQVAFGHLELPGFEMFRGAISDHGMDRNLLDKFDVVGSGHFHHRSTDGTVAYIGAFGEYVWSDFNDPRGFSVFDTDTRSLDFIHNPHIMFQKIFYDDSDNSNILMFDESKYAGKMLKIIVVNKTNPNTFDLFMSKIESCGAAEIQTVEDHLNLDQESDDHIVDEAEDTDVIIRNYIDSLKLVNINKPKLEGLITDLYKEAKELE
jgi:predicted phosphodiesterase